MCHGPGRAVSRHLTGTLAEPLSRGFPILCMQGLGSHEIQLFESHKKSQWGKFVLLPPKDSFGTCLLVTLQGTLWLLIGVLKAAAFSCPLNDRGKFG